MSKGSSATKTHNVQSAIKDLRRFLKEVEDAPREELQRSAETIYQEAIALTPYKTGKLERSVYVRVSADKRRGGLVAGASALSENGYNYAGIQHDNTSFNHPIKGEAFYISHPFKQEIMMLKYRLRRRLSL